MDLARHLTIVGEGRNEAADGHHSAVGKQLGHLAHAANVFLAIGGREAQVLVQSGANVVAVQSVGRNAPGYQVRLQFEGNRGLSSSTEACKGLSLLYMYINVQKRNSEIS